MANRVYTAWTNDEGEILQVIKDRDDKNYGIRRISDTSNVTLIDYLKSESILGLVKTLACAADIDILVRGEHGRFESPRN
jgi:hypothetical protein